LVSYKLRDRCPEGKVSLKRAAGQAVKLFGRNWTSLADSCPKALSANCFGDGLPSKKLAAKNV